MDYVLAILANVGRVYHRCIMRVGLWLVTVFGGLYPAIHAAKIHPSLSFYNIAKDVNHAGLFKDFYYISVVIALLSMCEIVDLYFRRERPHYLMGPIYLVAFIAMLFIFGTGIGEFSTLVDKGFEKYILTDEEFHYDFVVILVTGAISLFVEILLAFRGE